jgi:hypothetical protein
MSIVFAGAPVVNAIVALLLHPPASGLAGLRWPFVLGIVLAAAGGCLVMLYKPPVPAARSVAAEAAETAPAAARER